ncbi:SMI1/KNR4 family protein [Bacillus sp. DX1.1]|uniref:SMI1/KNR4 family protein n=1 Tax=unclassified Bacillus (in: firmicutes) TaxID=185979 RepID=UPI0025704C47|nr:MULTISPECIES: SMI1/KNR4 family protein [unclassified Bacillus (in: firmicutes)]MDM5155406.1 SMI1/KNR4 family protein [Bacillus sp. DX1.1]WJE79721.1 SMI1/KNR4 family protein [Bacillus sp. DX3.1]
MEPKLAFLRKYKRNVKLLSLDKIDDKVIPSTWHEVFKEHDSKKRIDMVLEIWRTYIEKELSNTIVYLEEHLINVELIENNDIYSMLYTLKTSDGEIEYYEAGNPMDRFDNKVLEASWDRIPISVREFYEKVHNGFYYYASGAMGLVPFACVTYFDDDEWGIIEELEEPLQIDLKTTFGFFKSGMGGYVAIDYNNCEYDKATLWFTNDQPEYNINFWNVVDEWIVIGFEA